MANYQSTHTGAEIDAGIDKVKNDVLVKPNKAVNVLVGVEAGTNKQKNYFFGEYFTTYESAYGEAIKPSTIPLPIGGGYSLTITSADGGSYDGKIFILGFKDGIFGWHEESLSQDAVYTGVIMFQNTTTSNGLGVSTSNAVLNTKTNSYVTGLIGNGTNQYTLFLLNADASLYTRL